MTTLSFQMWRELCAPDIVGTSPAIVHALEATREVSAGDDCVLLTGEPGTSKALFARAIHRTSERAAGPFVVVNCATIPEALLEAELYGSQRSARVGRIANAHGGTVFFEEVADLSIVAQVKLLRVIDQHVVGPLGGNTETHVDVRVLTASHRNLQGLVARGLFRADLLQRIATHQLVLPPLRERGTDVCALAEAMLHAHAARHGVRALDASARAALLGHPWKGNVTELHLAIERGLRHASTPLLTADDLDLGHQRTDPPFAIGSDFSLDGGEGDLDRGAVLAELERRLIDQALHRTSGDRTAAAARLGIKPTALIAKLKLRRPSS